MLVIAHRLSTIRDADVIAVVANGKIVEVCIRKCNGCHGNMVKMTQNTSRSQSDSHHGKF